MVEMGEVNKNGAMNARGRERGIHGGHQKKDRKNTFPTQVANCKLKFPSVFENRTEKNGQ